MKKELFKIKSVLSTTALIAMFSIPSFAQDANISKIEQFENKQVKIDSTFVKKPRAPRPRVESISKIKPNGIKTLDAKNEMVAPKKIDFTLTKIVTHIDDDKESKEIKATLKKVVNHIEDTEESKKFDADLAKFADQLQEKEDSKKIKATLVKIVKNVKDENELKRIKATLTKVINKVEDSKEKREEVETVSTLKPEGIKEIKVENEISTDLIVKMKKVETEETEEKEEKEEKEEGVLSREQYLENYICQKENQLQKLEDKFTSFQKTITESTLAMQTAIAQIGMLNQNQNSYQIHKVPTLTDRNSYLYPMMMMQSMQNQMMIQNMSSNYAQSMNQMMVASMYSSTQNMSNSLKNNNSAMLYNMTPNNQQMGQKNDAQTSNTQNLNNVQETFNPNRTMAVTKESDALTEQSWSQFTKASQAGFKFDAVKANPKTGMEVKNTETPKVETAAVEKKNLDEFGG